MGVREGAPPSRTRKLLLASILRLLDLQELIRADRWERLHDSAGPGDTDFLDG